MIKWYYDPIKERNSYENVVDNFWNNCVPHYFKQDLMYGLEQEQRLLEGVVKQRADFTIRYITNGALKKVALFENKRGGYDTQTAVWVDALKQLTNYLKLVHTEQGGEDILYGNVIINIYTRFYMLMPGEQTMHDYVEQPEPLELKTDEEIVHRILIEWVYKTSG